jgi:hypothetical protein
MKHVLIACVAVVLLVAFGVWVKGCLDVDWCLDHGGRWNYEGGRCEFQ